MRWQSALAIYTLFWVLSAFVVMPFGIRSHHETGVEHVRGQDHGAPVNFDPRRILIRTTIVATIAFVVFLLNYSYGWVTPQSLDFVTPEKFKTLSQP
jgi:predicted secreted protein